ncbi:hypothetical protein [Saccharopolyspora gloriosae]|uniref:hypothetical protein n=1 Tax=Saccharopolyspora gloriosae TaxID=455344 RepID=UPI001FB61BD6|nr:hypothetical protein [Saccharopolyspora gloriosae]
MFVLSANGDMLSAEYDDDSSVITFENAEDTAWRCQACGQALSEEPDGYADECGSLRCEAYNPYEDPSEIDDVDSAPGSGEGPHRPQRVPLAWSHGATIHTDPDEDSITVMINVGDPRGAFAFSVRRVPDDAPTNAGRLVMHTPYPGEPMPHAALTTDHAGTYWVG